MMLTSLAAWLRDAGLTVHEVPGWQGRSVDADGLTAVRTVVIHHTAGAATGDYPSLAVVRDGRTGLKGPLAQLGVGRGGTVYVIAAGQANHAGVVLRSEYGNPNSVGIEVESVGTGPVWPVAQVHATARAAAALCRRFVLPATAVLGHKEVCSPPGRKVDPVGIPGGMPELRALVNQYIHNPDLGGFLMALSEQEQRDMFNRIFGMLRQRWYATVEGKVTEVAATHAGAVPATVLDSLDGNYLRLRLDAVEEKLQEPAPVDLSDVQLDALADRVAARLGTLRFDVDPSE